ncbi:hypothetical protein ACOHYD_05610 [Desulfobacterota bacterium M19]
MALGQKIKSRRKETAYLFKSEAMRERLLTARQRMEGIDLEETCKKLDI